MTGFISECNISFNGGNLSSDTGALLPFDFIHSNSLLDPYSSLPFSDQRSSCSGRNSNFSLLKQQVFKYILGYSTQADQAVLKQDPILVRYFDGISSQSSISRFYRRISPETINAFWPLLMNQACTFVSRNQEDILLDADSTKTDTYGHQEDAAWIHHYSQVGYHPFVINEYHSKALVGAWLRPGSTYSADEAEAILSEVLSRIPQTTEEGKIRQIRFRGDAAFYNCDLMDLFEDREYPVGYAIRAKGTGKLEGECREAYESCEHLDDFTYTADNPFYGELRYQMSHSEKSRRVCFKLFFTEDEKDQTQLLLIPHIFAVITNIEEMNPEQIINFYCQRGNSENFTKELKNDFFANTLSHKSFEANAFDFFLKSLAYNLFRFFQFCVLEGSDQKMTAGSFRKKYQKIASRLSCHSRCLYLKIASSFRYASRFVRYLRKARSVRWVPDPV